MSGPAMTKSVRVLDRDGWGRSFVQRDEETGAALVYVILNDVDVDLLGDPERLTVTLEPGDMLND